MTDVEVTPLRLDRQRPGGVAAMDADPWHGVLVDPLGPLRKGEPVAVAGTAGRPAHAIVMETARVGKEGDGSMEQVLEELTALAQVAFAGVLVELREIPMRPAVRLQVDAEVAQMQDLVDRERGER